MRSNILSVITASGLLGVFIIGVFSGCTNHENNIEVIASRPSITVYPIRMADQTREDVAYTVALLLEKGGIENIEVNHEVFTPAKDAAFDDQANAFAEFVKERELNTEYALYGAFIGSPERGVDEIQGILVNTNNGDIAWSECQTHDSSAFKKAKPGDPLSCTVFLVDRLRKPLDLLDPMRADAPKGKMDEYWKKDSLTPTTTELDQMQQRLTRLQNADTAAATLLVYPVRAGTEWSGECAQQLADGINRSGLMTASVAASDIIEFKAQPAANEQKVLWSAARSIRDIVRTKTATGNQPETDYILIADYIVSPDSDQSMVHTFLLESDGDWVIVDYQNSHHKDYNKIRPRSLDDCCDLSVIRMSKYLDS